MSVALAKLGSSAKFGVVVLKTSILDSLGGPSAKISFNNITYYTWQIWALIVEICNCHVGGVKGGYIWHDCAVLTDCLLT